MINMFEGFHDSTRGLGKLQSTEKIVDHTHTTGRSNPGCTRPHVETMCLA